MISNVLNFVMSVYQIYMIEQISRAEWSVEHRDTTEARQTTQMDREVGAGYYDQNMVDMNFAFRNFYHNIPRGLDSILES